MPLDGTPFAESALAPAAALATRAGAILDLVSVMARGDVGIDLGEAVTTAQPGSLEFGDTLEQYVLHAMERVESEWGGRVTSGVLPEGETGAALRAYMDRTGADLSVAAARADPAGTGVQLGSLSDALFGDAPCPMLLVPGHEAGVREDEAVAGEHEADGERGAAGEPTAAAAERAGAGERASGAGERAAAPREQKPEGPGTKGPPRRPVRSVAALLGGVPGRDRDVVDHALRMARLWRAPLRVLVVDSGERVSSDVGRWVDELGGRDVDVEVERAAEERGPDPVLAFLVRHEDVLVCVPDVRDHRLGAVFGVRGADAAQADEAEPVRNAGVLICSCG